VVREGPLTVVGVATDCCDENHERAIRIMRRYAPLAEIVTTDQVLAGR
jgi:hypothetical protein